MMSESAGSIYSLLENLLEWSRTQRGAIPYNPEKVDLCQLTNDILKLSKSSAEKKHIELINNVHPSSTVFADVNMTNTLIRNLISNAIKFTPDDGKIEVGTKDINSADYIAIYIKDSGLGISKETQEKLFRIDSHVTTLGTNKETGTGLGLILCKEFVDSHSGKIWVESELGQGCTFFFTLPKCVD
jgi:signal transduction histidine kinase